MADGAHSYVEPGGSWRPFRLLAGVLAVGVLVQAAAVPGLLPPPAWALAGGLLIAFGAHALMARRAWTVRLDGQALSVGREQVPRADVDTAHLRAVGAGTAGVDVGAPVLGGSASPPRGRAALPLRTTDGRTVLVPTRDPAALTRALLAGVPDTTDRPAGGRGTLGS